MLIFILLILIVVAVIYFKKSAEKEKERVRKAKLDAKREFVRSSEKTLKSQYGFTDNWKRFSDDKDFTAELIIDTDANKIAYIAPEKAKMYVTTGDQIISVDTKEIMESRSHNSAAVTTLKLASTWCKELKVIIVTRDIGTLEFFAIYDTYGSPGGNSYGYTKAVEVKSLIEDMLKVTKNTDAQDTISISDEVKKLNDLYNQGVISEEEFSKAKEKLLA